MKYPRSLPLLALTAAAACITGCTTTEKSAAEGKPKAAQQETYVQVPSVGSWIPRKVKKKEDLIGDSTQVVEGAALEKATAIGATRTTKESQISNR